MSEPTAAPSSTPSGPPAGAPPPSGPPPAAPSAPAGGREGSSSQATPAKPPAGTPGAAEGTSEQAAATPEGVKPIDEPHVPWRKFREVQTDATRARAAHQQEMGRITGQIEDLRRENQQLSGVRDDFRVLEQLIEENPDLAEQLFQRAGSVREGSKTAAAKPAVDPAILNEVRQLRSMIEGDRQRQTHAQEQQQLHATDTELSGVLGKLLAENRLDDGWLPHARAYVLDAARRIPTLEMHEVPYIFAEWAKPLQGLLVRQLNAWRNGKAEDARVLPPVPSTGGHVSGTVQHGANDNQTKRLLEERLRALGWKD